MEAAQLLCELPDEAEFASHNSRAVERWRDDLLVHAIDQVAEEVPVAMVYNGISYAVMLATPTSLEQFGLGFSLSERILRGQSELYDLEVVQRKEGIELQMTIAQERFAELKQQRRNLAGRTGCGLCGAESLLHVVRHPQAVGAGVRITSQALHAAFRELNERQPIHALTGAVHAAAWAKADGTLTHIEEDVGRHNALDKLIGTLAKNHTEVDRGFAIVTSRASYEMVQKAATIGISLLAAISAPTGLAINLAEQVGLTLVGFARNDRHVVYTHSQRLKSFG